MGGKAWGPGVYFSDFGLEPEVLEEYGAFNVALVDDLPLFVDPFLLYDSENAAYKGLHEKRSSHTFVSYATVLSPAS